MKNLLLILLALPTIGFSQNLDIPDANFKEYLIGNMKINSNGDNEIQFSEASSYKGSIDCSNQEISNLKGIEAFTALTKLKCGSNKLSNLDVSKNAALIELECYNNELTTLDVTKNTALTALWCQGNKIVTLDLNKNNALSILECGANQLKSLSVSKNTLLNHLNCCANLLSVLDVSNNSALTF